MLSPHHVPLCCVLGTLFASEPQITQQLILLSISNFPLSSSNEEKPRVTRLRMHHSCPPKNRTVFIRINLTVNTKAP